MSGGRGVRGNRAVSPLVLLGPRGDLSGAGVEAIPKEGSEPKASDAHSAVPDAWVDDRVGDVHEQIHEDEHERKEEDAALQHWVVAVEDRVT